MFRKIKDLAKRDDIDLEEIKSLVFLIDIS